MRSKKVLVNIGVMLLLRLIAIICGLIIPRLIIETYGSNINGLMVSITQYVSYIVLLEAGLGGVIRAALYKPLSQKNTNLVSSILKSAEKYFRIIAGIFLIYLVLLSFTFQILVDFSGSIFFVFSFVLIIGISTFFQYYFGITYQILLHADQKQYINSYLQIITLIINTLLIILLIKINSPIHFVLIGSSIIFLLRPLYLNFYVKRNYNLNKEALPEKNALKQKWDGFGHHIAFLLHSNTDVALLTIFTNFVEVSVYSIYYMVISSVQSITVTFSTGLEAAFGNMIANKEKKSLERNFQLFEFTSFTITTVLFSTLSLLILPFINIYTNGISDANYLRPTLAFLLVSTGVVYCIKVPYSSVVLAAGHYKQTRNGAFSEAGLNIILSLVLINFLGSIGVVIGTLIATIFRTLQYVTYLSKHILYRSVWVSYKKIVVYSLTFLIIYIICINSQNDQLFTYSDLIFRAIEVFLISLSITLISGMLFYLKDIKLLYFLLKNAMKK